MGAERCGRVAVQSLHLVSGLEYRAMTTEIAAARLAGGPPHIHAGAPLIRTDEDIYTVAAALTSPFSENLYPEDAVVWVGHGGRATDNVYARLAAAVTALDRRVLLGTLAGENGVENIIETLRALCGRRAGRVRLVPLLAAVGRHAAEDIAGAGKDSWRGRIAAAGFDCRVELKGLAEREDFARIWLARLTAALNAAPR
jgi:sirohydrochlorin cobaltochelatase